MPNHCENDLRITGTKKDVERFLAFAKTDKNEFDYNQFLPYPKKFAALDEAYKQWNKDNRDEKGALKPGLTWNDAPRDGFNSGGYEWCITTWGTKWNAYNINIEPFDGESVVIHFKSAWAPPKPVIEKAGEMFPALEFDLRYFECGAAFNGILRIEKGEVTHDETGTYFGERGG